LFEFECFTVAKWKEGLSMSKPILFYDGECGFCASAVQFMIDHENSQDFLFASLQGELASQTLPGELINDLNTVVVKHEDVIYTRTNAVIFMAKYLRKPYSYIRFLRIVPRPLRDVGYNIVARNRDFLSQSRKLCKIPSNQGRKRFID